MKWVLTKFIDSKAGKIGKGLFLHPLFSGSAVMIVGSNLANFLAYLYHLVIGRLLGPASYGELSAVISVLSLIFSSLNFLGLVIVKFVSSAKKEDLVSLYSWFTKIALKVGLVLAIVILILTPFFSNFLHINIFTFSLVIPVLSFSVLLFVYKSFLQGLMKFKEVVIANNTEFAARLVFGIIFVSLGFSTFGAMFGIVLSTTTSFILLRYFLRNYQIKQRIKDFTESKRVMKYAVPIFIATVSTNSIMTTDVVLVKHFFDSHDAGIYASLSTLGRIIFFGAGPVGAVMFPMISRRIAEGKPFKKIFILSFMLASLIASGVLIIYWLLPSFSIRVLFGEQFIEGSSYLLFFGVFMTLFTLSSLLLNYYLSREKVGVVVIAVFVALMQALGIWLFHDSILTVVKVSIVSTALFLALMLLYFGNETKKQS